MSSQCHIVGTIKDAGKFHGDKGTPFFWNVPSHSLRNLSNFFANQYDSCKFATKTIKKMMTARKSTINNNSHDVRNWTIVVLLMVATLNSVAQTTPFARGADVSWCTEMEADGYKFRNAEGQETDLFALMKQLGMTAIRLRVWVNPEKFGYGAWCDKADVVTKARRAHEQGLDVMIDFHYSDFFADPATQNIPMDWEGYTMEQLKTAMADHTQDVLQALKDEGIEPKWVQVGNETNSGILMMAGRIDWNKSGAARFTEYTEISNAGYQAVKAIFPDAYVIVHLGGTENAEWFFKDFKAAGGKFDMIGLSHYPTETEWNSTASNATHSNINAAQYVESAARMFGVPVMLCETGFDVNKPNLASQVMKDLFARMTNIPQCAGIFYWEPQVDGRWKPAYYDQLEWKDDQGNTHQGWGAYGMGAFTVDGRPTIALDAFRDNPNGIKTMQASPVKAPAYYDLQGRRLSVPTQGIHIVNESLKLIRSY